MKTTKHLILLLICTVLLSCGGGISKLPATADGFSSIEKALKSQFGNDSYYTQLTIMQSESMGTSITTTVTNDPESMKMAQWIFGNGDWLQTSEITLEVPEGTKASDFMYQLGEEVSLEILGELVEKSKEQLTSKKNIENPRMEQAYIYFPKDGNRDKAEYIVNLEPENGGTRFRFKYKLDGSLIEMDY